MNSDLFRSQHRLGRPACSPRHSIPSAALGSILRASFPKRYRKTFSVRDSVRTARCSYTPDWQWAGPDHSDSGHSLPVVRRAAMNGPLSYDRVQESLCDRSRGSGAVRQKCCHLHRVRGEDASRKLKVLGDAIASGRN